MTHIIIKKKPNYLILVGTNRNAGKTTMACKIIEANREQIPVIGIKISPHFHEIQPDAKILKQTGEYIIIEETKNNTGKDSSRMLNAGAQQVFYVQVWDENLEPAMHQLMQYIPEYAAVVCESGWVRNLVEPGLFIVLHRLGDTDQKNTIKKYTDMADRLINFDGRIFDLEANRIQFKEGIWTIR